MQSPCQIARPGGRAERRAARADCGPSTMSPGPHRRGSGTTAKTRQRRSRESAWHDRCRRRAGTRLAGGQPRAKRERTRTTGEGGTGAGRGTNRAGRTLARALQEQRENETTTKIARPGLPWLSVARPPVSSLPLCPRRRCWHEHCRSSGGTCLAFASPDPHPRVPLQRKS